MALFNKSKLIFLLLFIALPLSSIAQSEPITLKYLGTAGWIIKDGKITVLVDPYISRVKLGTGPGIHPDDTRATVLRSDNFVSDTVGIDSLVTNVDFTSHTSAHS